MTLTDGGVADQIDICLGNHDYVTLAVLCADALDHHSREHEIKALLTAVVEGRIRLTHNQDVRAGAMANFALALLHLQRPIEARTVAEQTTRANPGDAHLKLTCIGIIIQSGASREACSEMLTYVRRFYRLEEADQRFADRLEHVLEN